MAGIPSSWHRREGLGAAQPLRAVTKEVMMESHSFSVQHDTPRPPHPLPQLGLGGCADGQAPLSSDSLSDSFHNLIGRYRVRGQYAEMEPLCHLALEIQEQTL